MARFRCRTHTVDLVVSTEGLVFSNYDGAYILDSLTIYDMNDGNVLNMETSLVTTASYNSNTFDNDEILMFDVSYREVNTDQDNAPEELEMVIKI